jgi:hypothetical protein
MVNIAHHSVMAPGEIDKAKTALPAAVSEGSKYARFLVELAKLIVENNVQKGTMNFKPALAIVKEA